MDINATRVKEWIPNLHPNAPDLSRLAKRNL